jgi:UDP:flavonoid glycosyltransferase YjiC (YdhE family)
VRILITSWGSYGDVYPYVGLARALKAEGHQPVIVMPEFYRPLIESLDFEFHPAGPLIDPNDRAVIERLMDPVHGSEVLLRSILMPTLRADYEALDAVARDVDVMVTHPVTFAGPVVAQARGLPWISTVLAPMSFFSRTDIPVLAPAPFLGHLAGLSVYGRAVASLVRRSTRSWMTPVFDLRRDVGLPPGEHPLFEGQFSPTLTLALFSRVLGDPQPDWPSHVVITGFVFYNGPETLAPELEAFLSAGPPPVVFTLGTSAVAAAGRFYEESIEAVRRLGIRAVLLTGGFEQNRPRTPPPPGVLLVDRAPHQLLFPRAPAVVHQGGAGTLAQALRAGKPMLVVPHAHDQPDNAARVTRLGVARTVLPRRYRAARVAREVQFLLADPGMAARAAEVAALVRGEGGAAAAAKAISAVCATLVRGNANDSRHVSQSRRRLDA